MDKGTPLSLHQNRMHACKTVAGPNRRGVLDRAGSRENLTGAIAEKLIQKLFLREIQRVICGRP
jgi:hypothetical protein